MDNLKAAILIVSTTAAKDASTDATGSILRNVFQTDGGDKWTVSAQAIVTDHVSSIQRQIMSWADGPDAVNLIITTGGTGFAIDDGTPEVQERQKEF